MSQSLRSESSFTNTDDVSITETPYYLFEKTQDPDYKSRTYVIYNSDHNREWQDWWKSTSWRAEHPNKALHWDNSGKKSTTWEFYVECASISTGTPHVQCKRCHAILAHPSIGSKTSAGLSTMTRHPNTESCKRAAKFRGQPELDLSKFGKKKRHAAMLVEQIDHFDKDLFEQQTIKTIIALRESFRAVENVEFRKLIRMASFAPSPPVVLSEKQVRDRLHKTVEEVLARLKEQLPKTGKISIALDAWQSPNKHAFLGILGYYFDNDWNLIEVLLGFEHLTGSHTGRKMADVVLKVLTSFDMGPSQILTITSDNAAPNITLCEELEIALGLVDAEVGGVNHIPCLAHVIQLCVKRLVEHMKIKPRNNKVITEWYDDATLRENHTDSSSDDGGVPETLKLVRDLTIYINASAERKERFMNTQSGHRRRLNLIQDIATRWNSTFDMLVRAHRLRTEIMEFCQTETRIKSLNTAQWRQVEYLAEILYPFCVYTNAIGRTKNGPTIQNVFNIYNKLFDQLDAQIGKLDRKRLPWKVKLRESLEAGRGKLEDYYSRTKDSLGDIYGVATILAPEHKLSFFDHEDWTEDEQNWRDRYHEKLLAIHRSRVQTETQLSSTSTQHLPLTSSYASSSRQTPSASTGPFRVPELKRAGPALDDLLGKPKKRKITNADKSGDIAAYLEDTRHFDTDPTEIKEYWKRGERVWPELGQIARDYLAIPAASVGVERLFNLARDLVFYRRHNLKPETIRALMILLHGGKADLVEEIRLIEAAEAESVPPSILEESPEDEEEILDAEIMADIQGFISDGSDSEAEPDNWDITAREGTRNPEASRRPGPSVFSRPKGLAAVPRSGPSRLMYLNTKGKGK